MDIENLQDGLDRFLTEFKSIPSAQRVIAALLRLLKEDDIDIDEIAKVIRVDSALSADVLRMSNSAYYGMSTAAESIDEAIIRLGFAETIKLASLAAVREMTSTEGFYGYPFTREQVWQNGVVAGATMTFLAKGSLMEPSLAYTVGLLHGSGRWVLSQALQKHAPPEMRAPSIDMLGIAAWEQEIFGSDYARLGGDLMKRWNYPDQIADCVASHLDPMADLMQMEPASMLHVAMKIAAHIAVPELNGSETLEIAPEILGILGRDATAIAELVPKARAELEETLRLLKTERRSNDADFLNIR